jgi:short-subunit dehydrogenase
MSARFEECGTPFCVMEDLDEERDMRFEGKVALVTGGASGLGSAFCHGLAREGARVVVADIQAEAGQGVADAIVAEGGEAIFAQLDVADPSAWQAAIDTTMSHFSRLDILINSAGIGPPASIVDCSLEEWNKVLAVNLTGTFLGCKLAIPAMVVNGGGAIVNIASIYGMVADQLGAAYCTSKAGVTNLTKAVALHCATTANGVRCNSLHPGFIMTPMVEAVGEHLSQDVLEAYTTRTIGQIPVGRAGTPEDMVGPTLFLVSDEARYLNGSGLVADGGFTAR